jgi:hypothetical protein
MLANANLYRYSTAGTCGRVLPGVEIKIDHDASRDKPGEGEAGLSSPGGVKP